jgi:hypothetical protein
MMTTTLFVVIAAIGLLFVVWNLSVFGWWRLTWKTEKSPSLMPFSDPVSLVVWAAALCGLLAIGGVAVERTAWLMLVPVLVWVPPTIWLERQLAKGRAAGVAHGRWEALTFFTMWFEMIRHANHEPHNNNTRSDPDECDARQTMGETPVSNAVNSAAVLWAAVIGDLAGSTRETGMFKVRRTDSFPLLSPLAHTTDDSILIAAIADSLMTGADTTRALESWTRRGSLARFGGRFQRWAWSGRTSPYNSYGNGVATRVIPISCWYPRVDQVALAARDNAIRTRNHPEGVRAAVGVRLKGHTR